MSKQQMREFLAREVPAFKATAVKHVEKKVTIWTQRSELLKRCETKGAV